MTSPAGPATQAGLLALVSSFTATGIIATSIYVPSLPAIGQDLSASPAAVKLTLSVFLATFAVGQLVYGPISDRIGRRPTLISGLAICVLASIGCIFAPDIWSLVGARIVQGLGACVGVVVTRAVIRDLYGRSGAARAMSRRGSARRGARKDSHSFAFYQCATSYSRQSAGINVTFDEVRMLGQLTNQMRAVRPLCVMQFSATRSALPI